MATLKEGQRAIRRLIDRLERSDGLSEDFAKALLQQAQGVAASHPTPQSRMAAEGMGVRHGQILSLSGGPPGEVAAGSEFGSTFYRQFGPRRQRGYWLLPSADSPNAATIGAGEDWLDEQVRDSIRGF